MRGRNIQPLSSVQLYLIFSCSRTTVSRHASLLLPKEIARAQLNSDNVTVNARMRRWTHRL